MSYGISFDFWNTLFADGAEKSRREKRINYIFKLLKSQKNVTLEDVTHAFDLAAEYFINEWRVRYRTPTNTERIKFILNHLKIKLDPKDVSESVRYFAEIIHEIPPRHINGVNELIPRLARKYPLGIISDTGYITGFYLKKFLEQENLNQHFQSMLFSDEQGVSKPHVDLFKKTAQNLKVSLNNLIHIGDLERTDVGGAVDSGCISVLFTGASGQNGDDTKAHYVINEYEELEQILRDISGNSKALSDK